MTFRAERFHWGDDGEFDWHPPVTTEKAWDEGKHPRDPAGTPTGGQFTSGGGSEPAGPAPKLPGVADIPPYKGRHDDVHPDDGKKIYDNRVDPQYLTKSPKLKDVTEVTSGIFERGNYYRREWGRRDDKGNLIIIEVSRKGRISSPDWFDLKKDPFEETVPLRRNEPLSPDDDNKMRLIGIGTDLDRVRKWQTELQAQLDALEKAGKVGEKEWENINRMEVALGFYLNANEDKRKAGHASLVEIHDGNNKLLAAVFTQHNPDTRESTIEGVGGIEHDALVKALRNTVLFEQGNNRAASIEKVLFSDDADTIAAMKEVGFRQIPMETEGVTRMVYGVTAEERGLEKAKAALEHSPVPIQMSEGVGGDFKFEVGSALAAIPAPTLQALAEEGIRFRLGNSMTELNPDLKGVHPRGWPAGTTWDTADGMFQTGTKAVNVTETYRPIGQKKFVRSTRVRGAMLHETGHAFDSALKRPSENSRMFIDAYERDVKSMPTAAKRGLRYYLQKGKAGRSEAFAETFAWVTGNVGSARTDLRLFFPNIAKLIKQAADSGVWLERT